MPTSAGLNQYHLIGFAPITDVDRAKEFYRDKLGLTLVEEQHPFALVFDANGTMLRLTMLKEFKPFPFTILGWQVPDIVVVAKALATAGIQCERYGHFKQDEHGIWSAPGGAKVAWFKDPDGNVLSISQH